MRRSRNRQPASAGSGGGRRWLVLCAATLALLLPAGPAAAANPVLDPEDDADVAATLAEATEVQGVCYGYLLLVDDGDTGEWGGAYAASSGGEGVRAADADCPDGVVELVAQVVYTSDFSEAEDSAAWDLRTDLAALTIDDVEDQGLSVEDLLDDERSAATLLHAVLSLPRLAAEQAGLEPVVAEPNADALPDGARPTGSPSSDWLREHLPLLGLSVAAVLSGLVALVASFRRSGPPRGGPSGPRPGPSGPGPRPGSLLRSPGPARPPAPSTTSPWRST